MGNHLVCQQCFNRRTSAAQENRKIRILFVGLDNAGKTTAAKGLAGEVVTDPAPTLGFSRLETGRHGWSVELFDVGGGRGIRGIWPNYLAESHGLVFVVDAGDPGRTEEGRQALHGLLQDERVQGKPVLVLANKQDVPAALDEVELNERLGLERAANRYRCPMRIELCTARPAATARRTLTAETGFSWLTEYVIDNFSSLESRVATDLAVRAAEIEMQRRARDERIRLRREEAAVAEKAGSAAAAEPVPSFEASKDSAPDADVGGGDTAARGVLPAEPDPPPASPPARPASPPPRETSPESAPSDATLQPELEAEIQEVFTRTEMGRRVRERQREKRVEEAAESAEVAREGERPPDGETDTNGEGTFANGATPGGEAAGNGETADAGEVSRGGDASRAGTCETDGRGGPEPNGNGWRQTVEVHSSHGEPTVNGRHNSRESADSPVLEDSGQGSTKESDSDLLMSSNASQLSSQNGFQGPRKRNRFFKRYTKTSPMPDDVRLTSVPSTPLVRDE